jgi:hypothetical protein
VTKKEAEEGELGDTPSIWINVAAYLGLARRRGWLAETVGINVAAYLVVDAA